MVVAGVVEKNEADGMHEALPALPKAALLGGIRAILFCRSQRFSYTVAKVAKPAVDRRQPGHHAVSTLEYGLDLGQRDVQFGSNYGATLLS
jgi:hypothetical protein